MPALKDEVMTITKNINDDELNRVINQYEAGILMSREKSSTRVGRMVGELMLFGKIVDTDEILDIVKNLKKQEIMDTMLSVLSGKPTLAVYGDVKKDNADILLKGLEKIA